MAKKKDPPKEAVASEYLAPEKKKMTLLLTAQSHKRVSQINEVFIRITSKTESRRVSWKHGMNLTNKDNLIKMKKKPI